MQSTPADMDFDLLPATTYRPPSPGSPTQVRRRRRSLNTIMEDDEESTRGSSVEGYKDPDISLQRANWLSPLSDHFPTPRGMNFMSAPIIPPSSTSSDTESISPTPSSAPWSRESYTSSNTEFDDLYDVSSDEEERRKSRRRSNTMPSNTKHCHSRSSTTSHRGSRSSLPSLVTTLQPGGDPWPGVAAFKLLTSPIPPTPPPKVPMSPAIFSYLQSQEVPSMSAPPSLDGSFSSEQMALMSAPATPDIDNDSESVAGGNGWGIGVQLQPDAMATLQALAGSEEHFEHQGEQVIEFTEPLAASDSPHPEMVQSLPPVFTNIRRNDSIVLSSDQQRSLNSLTRLEIPSPGGFFSALSPNARHTWHLVPCSPDSARPPSSTTAEHFYKTPWNSVPVERILEVSEPSEAMSDGLPTAKPNLSQQKSDMNVIIRPERPELHHESSDDTITGVQINFTLPTEEEIVPDEILIERSYTKKLEAIGDINIDRTGLWLAAQRSYLEELINPTEDHDDELTLLQRNASVKSQKEEAEAEAAAETSLDSSPPRKTVRFSEIVTVSNAIACPLPTSKLGRHESAYYRAFQHLIAQTRHRDTFVHRIPRFEALQSHRISFPASHRAHLLGKYQLSVVPMSAKRRLSANVARGDELCAEDPEKLKRDREVEARTQMAPAAWNVMAIKLLNGGRLIAAPIAKRLARLSSMGPKINKNGVMVERARILDLGGMPTCDWAWHCASEYPHTKIYTITTKALRQLSNSNIRGPSNHRQVAVERLSRLPFKDNQFDLICAKEIYTILKERAVDGRDEWDLCLSECMRVLKPGGYLEFSVMDSDIVNAGPLGLAKSVEFGFNLKTLGYDPCPTKLFLSRLRRAGFVGIKRAWVFLPMGSKVFEASKVERDSMGVEKKLVLEAMVTGSTEGAASVAGIVGAWAWEKWLLRCQVQTLGPDVSVPCVGDIIEEGRTCGAGWRTVSGWARKPLGY